MMKIHKLLVFSAIFLTSCTPKLKTKDYMVIHLGKADVYQGETVSGKPDGFGRLMRGDSMLYVGYWKKGMREGIGRMTDAKGRVIQGKFRRDSLYSGRRTDEDGVYVGEMNAQGLAWGHGIYRAANGFEYEGRWQNDVADGFGFSMTRHNHLKVGEWKDGIFKGERLNYTSERIYGIDISKYQHVIKKKHYPINWSALRIIHLGTLSKKKITGKVNYPISFIYIKSTEGKSLRNVFYPADYKQARKHGFRVGTYHFYSTTSPALAQAKHFLKHSHYKAGDLPPVLDVEPTDRQIAKAGGIEALFKDVRQWLGHVHSAWGARPILYVSQSFVNRHLSKAQDLKHHYRVWIARYGEYKPDVKLIYWQLCPDGRVQGIHGEVDINVFNGYRDEWNEYIGQIW